MVWALARELAAPSATVLTGVIVLLVVGVITPAEAFGNFFFAARREEGRPTRAVDTAAYPAHSFQAKLVHSSLVRG